MINTNPDAILTASSLDELATMSDAILQKQELDRKERARAGAALRRRKVDEDWKAVVSALHGQVPDVLLPYCKLEDALYTPWLEQPAIPINAVIQIDGWKPMCFSVRRLGDGVKIEFLKIDGQFASGWAEAVSRAKPQKSDEDVQAPSAVVNGAASSTIDQLDGAMPQGVTPGEWALWALAPDSDALARLIITADNGDTEICGVVPNTADAHLLVAAKEMFAALDAQEKFDAHFENCDCALGMCGVALQLRTQAELLRAAAVTKAKGGE